jgi:hypothetical protein
MSGPMQERLEGLSGYVQVFPPHDPKAAVNPIVYSHHRLNLGNQTYNVLSRVSSAGLDYSSRSNKYAHHVVLGSDERPVGGPAWLLSRPGFMEVAWQGEPRHLAAGRTLPQGDQPPGIAHAWQTLTGDAGWAGVLAETFLANPHRLVTLLFEPGMEILPLFVEALALLPPSRRWDVEFSTFFTVLPRGLSCNWRGVVAGSAAAKQAMSLPHVLLLELGKRLGPAGGGDLVHLARTGQHSECRADASALLPTRDVPSSGHIAVEPVASPSPEFLSLTEAPGGYAVIPDPSSREVGPVFTATRSTDKSRHAPARRWHARSLAGLVACLLACISLAAAWMWMGSGGNGSSVVAEATKAAKELKEKHDRANAEAAPIPAAPQEAANTKAGNQPASQRPQPAAKAQDTQDAAQKPLVHKPPLEDRTPVANQNSHAPTNRRQIIYWMLPSSQRSLFASADVAPHRKELPIQRVASWDFVVSDPSVRHRETRNGTLLFAKVGLGEEAILGTLRLEGREFDFHWADKPPQNMVQLVEDSALRVRSPEGDECIVFLRDPGISPNKEGFSIKREPREVRNKTATRVKTIEWCNKGALQDSKLEPFIRQWRIDARLIDHALTTLAKGSGEKPKYTCEIIEEKRATLELELPKKGQLRNEIHVTLDLDTSRMASERRRFREVKEDIEQLEKLERLSEEDRSSLRGLKEEMSNLKPIIEKYNHIDQAVDVRLHLIICIMVDTTQLELARFGTFPEADR